MTIIIHNKSQLCMYVSHQNFNHALCNLCHLVAIQTGL